MGEPLVGETDHVQLARLVTEVSWGIDHGQADTVHDLFSDDGRMTLGQTVLRGRSELLAWGRERAAVTYRTRHVCTNIRFVAVGEDRAEGTTVITQYVDDGGSPSGFSDTL